MSRLPHRAAPARRPTGRSSLAETLGLQSMTDRHTVAEMVAYHGLRRRLRIDDQPETTRILANLAEALEPAFLVVDGAVAFGDEAAHAAKQARGALWANAPTDGRMMDVLLDLGGGDESLPGGTVSDTAAAIRSLLDDRLALAAIRILRRGQQLGFVSDLDQRAHLPARRPA